MGLILIKYGPNTCQICVNMCQTLIQYLPKNYNSTPRPFCGNKPAGLSCKKTIIKTNTITFAIEVVAKK